MLRYYITDRHGCANLLDCVAAAVGAEVEYVQVREKDLSGRALLELTREIVRLADGSPTRILVNGRVDVALAAGAHGVHLPSSAVAASEWRPVVPASFLIGVSCHSVDEVVAADSADFVVFGPVFASPGKCEPVGLDGLRKAVRQSVRPVFALGGVDASNAGSCMDAGAVGIAGIRMFQSTGS